MTKEGQQFAHLCCSCSVPPSPLWRHVTVIFRDFSLVRAFFPPLLPILLLSSLSPSFQIIPFWLVIHKVDSVGKSVWIEFEVHLETWPSAFFSSPSSPAACCQQIPLTFICSELPGHKSPSRVLWIDQTSEVRYLGENAILTEKTTQAKVWRRDIAKYVCSKVSTRTDIMAPWKASGGEIRWKSLEEAELWYLNAHVEVLKLYFSYSGDSLKTFVYRQRLDYICVLWR